MANLAATAVTIDDAHNMVGFYGGKRRHVAATLVLTGQGGATNLIPADLFGLAKIYEAHSCRGSDNVIYVVAPLYNGSAVGISLVNGASGAPADLSATIKLVVVGPEATS